MNEAYQQTMGTKTYFFEKTLLFFIHLRILFFLNSSFDLNSSWYEQNHKESKQMKYLLFSSETSLQRSLQKQDELI